MDSTLNKIKTQNNLAESVQKDSEHQGFPSLSLCLDYRMFLKDFYEFKKKQTSNSVRPYSYATFSAAADIKSPNYLKMIVDGKRNLSDDMIEKFGKAMGLSKEHIQEFRYLVQYNQASDPAQRNLKLKELNEFRVKQQLRSGEIDQKTWDKVPNWVVWTLYSMLEQKSVDFKHSVLKKLLRDKASEDEIESAIKSLLQSGEVVKDATTGEFKKTRNLMDSADEIPVALVRKLQSELMYLGLESLHHDAANEREFGTLTLALTKDEFEELKFQLRKLRKTIHKDNSIKRGSSKGDRVYQLNLQLFPLTEKVAEAPIDGSIASKSLHEDIGIFED